MDILYCLKIVINVTIIAKPQKAIIANVKHATMDTIYLNLNALNVILVVKLAQFQQIIV